MKSLRSQMGGLQKVGCQFQVLKQNLEKLTTEFTKI